MNIFKDAVVVGSYPQVKITAFTYKEPGKDESGLTIKFCYGDHPSGGIIESEVNIGSDVICGVYDVTMVALPIVTSCRNDDFDKIMDELLEKTTKKELEPIWDQRKFIFDRYILPYVIYAIVVTIHDEFPIALRHDTESEIKYRTESITLLDCFIDEISEDLVDEECDDIWMSDGGGYDDMVERVFEIFSKMCTYTDLFPAEAIALTIFHTIDRWADSDEYCEEGIPEREVSDVLLRTDALCGIRTSMLVPVMDRQFSQAYYSEEE